MHYPYAFYHSYIKYSTFFALNNSNFNILLQKLIIKINFLCEDLIMVKIKEIFTSIQGEGPYVGYKQLFIRLCGCNLNCSYCDTDFDKSNSKEYSIEDLINICDNNQDCHSVSLTGGEPLLHTDFIKDFGSKCNLPIYLETNGTLPNKLKEVLDYITYISADIKLPSCTGIQPMWEQHEEFFRIASQKELFGKVVFDEKINDFEIHKITHLCKKYDIELILQPMMRGKSPSISSDFMQEVLDKCLKIYPKTRLIPQVHKFIDVI